MAVAYYYTNDKDNAAANFSKAAGLGDTDAQNWLKENGYR
jgi:hypothetical protein